MSRIPRSVLFAVLAVAVVVSFVIARSAGDSSSDATIDTGGGASVAAPAGTGTSSSQSTATTAPAPVPVLRAGKLAKLRVHKGDQVRFRVAAAKADEVHVHGYDTMYELAAGETKTISFKATIEGIFEIEFEGAGEQIASLRVDP